MSRSRPILWRAATWWLGRRLPAHDVAPVSGDLIEAYRRDRAARGGIRAEWRFVADALAVGRIGWSLGRATPP